MLRGREYLELVELFSATYTKGDYSFPVTTHTSQGNFPANVSEANGSKLLWYQRLGMLHPVTIELREVSFDIAKIIWQGREVAITSTKKTNGEGQSDQRGRFLEILGDYKEALPLQTEITTTTTAPVTTTTTQ